MKVLGHSETLNKDLATNFPIVGSEKSLHDNCLEGETWWTVLRRISGSGNFNFVIFTRGILE
jgi:hypothetical protein